jgi:hypothetical protein
VLASLHYVESVLYIYLRNLVITSNDLGVMLGFGLWWHLPDASLLALLAPWYPLQAFALTTALFRDFI